MGVFSVTDSSSLLPLFFSFYTTEKAKLNSKWRPLKFSDISQSVVKRVNNVNFLTWIDFYTVQWISKDRLIHHVIDN